MWRPRGIAVFAALVVLGVGLGWSLAPISYGTIPGDGGGGGQLCYWLYNQPVGGDSLHSVDDYLPPSYTNQSGWNVWRSHTNLEVVYQAERYEPGNPNPTYHAHFSSGTGWNWSTDAGTDNYRYTHIFFIGTGYKYSMEQWAKIHCH